MSLEINFIDYNKVTNTSDAFITCDELNCYVQYLSSTITTAPNIKKDKHTAGTTEDVHDFKIPDVKDKISPKKLKRINPFNKNHNEVILLSASVVDVRVSVVLTTVAVLVSTLLTTVLVSVVLAAGAPFPVSQD